MAALSCLSLLGGGEWEDGRDAWPCCVLGEHGCVRTSIWRRGSRVDRSLGRERRRGEVYTYIHMWIGPRDAWLLRQYDDECLKSTKLMGRLEDVSIPACVHLHEKMPRGQSVEG